MERNPVRTIVFDRHGALVEAGSGILTSGAGVCWPLEVVANEGGRAERVLNRD